MSLVFHGSDLVPFVFSDVVFLDGAESLLSRKSTKNIDKSFTYGDGVCISTLGHLCLVKDLILLGQVDASVFLGWRATSSDENLSWAKSDGGGALVELVTSVVRQLLERPLILINIVA